MVLLAVRLTTSGTPHSDGVTGGVYKARERIRCVQGPGTYSPHRADVRLLAIPTSRSRVSDSYPNYGRLYAFCSTSLLRFTLYLPL